ncbi:MAG: type II secretion system protein N [Chromatiaceae bacterium]|nr:type II secretion system protein N [Chromatiaceae bacterium]
MKGAKWYMAIAATSYIVALIFTAPAGLLAEHVLQSAVPQEVLSLRRVSGTLFAGDADLFVGGNSLGRGHWHFRPLSVLRGRLDFDVVLEKAGGRLQTVAGVGLGQHVVLRDMDGNIPIAVLRELLPAQIRQQLVGGELLLQVQSAELESGRLMHLDGVAVWRNAEVGAAGNVNLGDLRLVVTTQDDGTMQGTIQDGGGVLECRGNLQLSADGAYSGDISLGMRSGGPPSLGQALAMLGRPNQDGVTTMSLQGSVF